jgi:hypothetical protein
VDDAEVIRGGRGVWAATPWNYSSARFMMLQADGTGRLIYGYGQTIYAHILCRWEVPSTGTLRLTYLESPSDGLRFLGFSPEGEAVSELRYTLTPGQVSGEDDIVGHRYTYLWAMELSEPPWPPGLQLPHELPRKFFGHLVQFSQEAEPGADGGA